MNGLSTMGLQSLDDTYQEITRKFDEAVLALKMGQQTPREAKRTSCKLEILSGQLSLVLAEYERRDRQITPCLIETRPMTRALVVQSTL